MLPHPLRPPGLHPLPSASQLCVERCNEAPALQAWQLLGVKKKKKMSRGLRGSMLGVVMEGWSGEQRLLTQPPPCLRLCAAGRETVGPQGPARV